MHSTKLASLTAFILMLALLPACTTMKKSGADETVAAPQVVTSAANKGGMSPVTPPRAAPTPERAPVVNSAANKGGSSPVTPPARGSAAAIAANTQEVAILTTPPGAEVSINGQAAGVTPVSAPLDISKAYSITLKLPGYYIETLPVSAVAITGGNYMAAKGGSSAAAGWRMPTEIKATLKPVTDKYTALTTAVAALDNELKAGKLSPEQHKQMVADAVQFYSR